ncbi:MAG: hypothetical protein KDA37_05215 [Planctomycetales bacterium]|nr:hypothetical protein [Planctomycetales bacterium]
MRLLLLFLCCTTACASAPGATLAPLPSPQTQALLVGPTCNPSGCECVASAEQAGIPDAGKKRYEVHVGPMEHALWVRVGDQILYKDESRAERCFYLDLAEGRHDVIAQAYNNTAIGFQLQVSELNAAHKSRYDTYQFQCGGPGPCDPFDLREYAQANRFPNNLRDPCGSTKVRGVRWETKRLPDGENLAQLELHFTLDIAGFSPKHPSGAPACARD